MDRGLHSSRQDSDRGGFYRDSSRDYRHDGNREGRGRGGRGYLRVPNRHSRGSGEGAPISNARKNRMINLPAPEYKDELKQLREITLKLCETLTDEEGGDYRSNIQAFANAMIERGAIDDAEQYADFLVECFSQLTIHIPVLSTLVSLLLSGIPDFREIVRVRLETAIIQAIKSDEPASLRLLLKSIACLASAKGLVVSSATGLIAVISPILTVCEAAIANDNLNEQALVCFHLLFYTILWCTDVLAFDSDGKIILERTLEVASRFRATYRSPFGHNGKQAMTTRSPEILEDFSGLISVTPAIIDGKDSSVGDNLWEWSYHVETILSNMKSSGTLFDSPECMIVAWKGLVDEITPSLNFSTQFAQDIFDALDHQSLGARSRKGTVGGLTTFVIGDAASSGRKTSWLFNRFPVFSAGATEEAAACAALPPFVRSTCVAYCEDIIQFFDPVVYPSGAKYGSIDILISHLLSGLKLFPKEAHLEYLVTEVLFQHLLQVPINSAQHTMIGRLLLHLSKHHPIFAPAIGMGTNILFLLISELDVSVSRALADWFSFQFINSAYAWPSWSFWVQSCAVQEDGSPACEEVTDAEGNVVSAPVALDHDTILTRLFCHHVAQKCSRLVLYDRLKTAIPTAFHQYFDYDESPKCSYFIADARAADVNPLSFGYAGELRKLVEARQDPDDILDWMENLPQLAPEGNVKILTVMFVQAFCLVGAQSETLTTFLSLLEMYVRIFRELADTDEMLYIIAKTMFDACSHNAGLTTFLIQEMIHRSIVSTSAVAALLTEDTIMRALAIEPLAFQLFEITVDHTLGVFKAAVQRCRSGLALDETADLVPSEPVFLTRSEASNLRDVSVTMTDVMTTDETTAVTASTLIRGPVESLLEEETSGAMKEVKGDDDVQVDFSEEVDGGEEDGRRTRRRVDDDGEHRAGDAGADNHVGQRDTEDVEEERELDPEWVEREAAKIAVHGGRTVYRTLVIALSQVFQLHSTEENPVSEADISAVRAVARSLLQRIWRSYHGLEKHLEHALAQRVVACDNSIHAEVAKILIANNETELVNVWGSFLQH